MACTIGTNFFLNSANNELTVADNLMIYGRYFGLSRTEARRRGAELLDFVREQSQRPAEAARRAMTQSDAVAGIARLRKNVS